MITEKKTTLQPIIESSEGIHLTAYLVNRGDLIDLKSQLRETLDEAYEWLNNAMTTEERKKFLEPIDALLRDARIFRSMKGNIGIFRTKDSFRILNIPMEFERKCYVATSFHVKPLLHWMQVDREFLVLGLNIDSAHLFLGSQSSIQKIDSVLFPELLRQKEDLGDYFSLKKSRQWKATQDETFAWINDWLTQMTQKARPRLFLAGEKALVEGFLKSLKYTNVVKTPVPHSFEEHNLLAICTSIRKVIKAEAKQTLEQSLLEYRLAETMNLAKKNIFQIAKAVVQGRVRKLIVADGINVFGKIDKRTGGLALHPFDLDHEDDDILDDLAQTVLASGGEVVIARRDEIPKGRPILAILENQESELEQKTQVKELELLIERRSV